MFTIYETLLQDLSHIISIHDIHVKLALLYHPHSPEAESLVQGRVALTSTVSDIS